MTSTLTWSTSISTSNFLLYARGGGGHNKECAILSDARMLLSSWILSGRKIVWSDNRSQYILLFCQIKLAVRMSKICKGNFKESDSVDDIMIHRYKHPRRFKMFDTKSVCKISHYLSVSHSHMLTFVVLPKITFFAQTSSSHNGLMGWWIIRRAPDFFRLDKCWVCQKKPCKFRSTTPDSQPLLF